MPTPSLLIVPARFKSGKLYSQIPTSGAGDFTVTRATAATRVNASGFIESVASGIPRLDYFASGGTVGCPALLVEPSGSNLLLRSEEFDNATWSGSASGTIVTPNAINSPSNTLTADLITRTTGGNIQQTIALTSGTTYTSSYFLKKGTVGNEVLIVFAGTGFSVSITVFNFDTLTLTDTTGTTSNKSIIDYGNGWYRISLTKQATSTNNGIFRIAQNNNSENYYIWGAQLETGSVATSYIPTTTGSVTRNADVVSVSGAVSGSIGQAEGTIYAEVAVSNITASKNILQIDDGTANNRIGLFVNTSPTRLTLLMSSGNVTENVTGSVTTGIMKIAASYSSGNVQVFTNGSFLVSGTIATYPTITLNAISVGSRITSGVYGIHFNDRIRAVALYTARLSNAELASLTTP